MLCIHFPRVFSTASIVCAVERVMRFGKVIISSPWLCSLSHEGVSTGNCKYNSGMHIVLPYTMFY